MYEWDEERDWDPVITSVMGPELAKTILQKLPQQPEGWVTCREQFQHLLQKAPSHNFLVPDKVRAAESVPCDVHLQKLVNRAGQSRLVPSTACDLT